MPRLRKDVALLKLEGTYRPDRHHGRVADPGLLAAPIECPKTLTDARTRTAWSIVVNRLAFLRRVGPEDVQMLEGAFALYETFWHARDVLKTIPVEDAATFKLWHGVQKSAFAAYADTMRRFGCGTADRLAIERSAQESVVEQPSLAARMCAHDDGEDD